MLYCIMAIVVFGVGMNIENIFFFFFLFFFCA